MPLNYFLPFASEVVLKEGCLLFFHSLGPDKNWSSPTLVAGENLYVIGVIMYIVGGAGKTQDKNALTAATVFFTIVIIITNSKWLLWGIFGATLPRFNHRLLI